MNLRRRTRRQVFIARPQPVQGSMGGMSEQFAAPHQSLYGFLLPDAASLKPHTAGLHEKSSLKLLLPPCADVLAGDGIGFSLSSFPYRVTRCDRYPLHICVQMEAKEA